MDIDEYKKKLITLLGIDNIDDNIIKYFCTKYPEWEKSYDIQPLFNDINLYEFSIPVERLNYPQDIIDYARSLPKSFIEIDDDSQEKDKDDIIMLEYTKCNNLNIVMTFWYKIDENVKDIIIKYLSEIGCIYCIKYIKISFKAVQSLVYQMFSNIQKYKSIDEINNLLINDFEYLESSETCDITVILFNNKNEEHIELIKLCIRQILEKDAKKFTIIDKFYKVIEIVEIYMNYNSLKFLEMQLLERHISFAMKKSRIFFATFRKWFYSEISLLNQRNILLFSGAILYVLGIRRIRDIDVYIDGSTLGENESINKCLIDKSKFSFIDLIMQSNTKTWKLYWNTWSKKWANLIGANDFNDIVYNPKFHFYYMGMKFMILEGDIERRLVRHRPRAIVDLIMINKLLNYNIKIPYIPTYSKKYKPYDEKIPLSGGESYIPENNEIEYMVEIDKNDFIETMRCYFKITFNLEYTPDEIKKMVGIKKIKIKK